MYSAPISLGFDVFAMFFALALMVPIGLLVFNWLATIWGGTLHIRAALLFALGAISALTIGLAGELAWSVIPVGWQIGNTTAAQGDTTAVIVGGAVLAGFAALHYWFPKLCGRMMGEGLGKLALGTILAGLYVYVLMAFFAGVKGQPVDIYKYFAGNGARRLQPRRVDRGLRGRDRDRGRARQRRPQLPPRRRGGARSLGRRDARVVRALAAAGAQLRRRSRRAERRAPPRHPQGDPRSHRSLASASAARGMSRAASEPEVAVADDGGGAADAPVA